MIQQTFVLALVIFIAGGLQFKRYFLWKSMAPMIITTLMCIILGWDGTYSRLDGVILFGTFLLYMAFLSREVAVQTAQRGDVASILSLMYNNFEDFVMRGTWR